MHGYKWNLDPSQINKQYASIVPLVSVTTTYNNTADARTVDIQLHIRKEV
jgi:hypothetical protein